MNLPGVDRLVTYVQEHGRPYTPAARPQGVRKRADKACFLNALNYVCQYPGHLYVEGLATRAGDAAIHHAWMVEEGSDTVIEVTWNEPGTAYHGIAYTAVEVAQLAADEEQWGGALRLSAPLGTFWEHDPQGSARTPGDGEVSRAT